MNVLVNGKKEVLQEGMRVAELLVSRNLRAEMVAVELNGKILQRDEFDATPLSEGDKVEFLYYMGGGQS